ncbi:hypothetical protein QVD17_29836 [Tagetes erecta]|uniref:Uncharacterized protein n=1 Tax=Tagetes erecta TaxID=13708 RepID=A0AAD8K326_TARER|nr:hypothetical protein QVD17_29836 [Tagetes erecta]
MVVQRCCEQRRGEEVAAKELMDEDDNLLLCICLVENLQPLSYWRTVAIIGGNLVANKREQKSELALVIVTLLNLSHLQK